MKASRSERPTRLTVSHVRGPADVPLDDDTVWDVLADAARRWPGGCAAEFVEHGVRLTWSQLLRQAEQAAAGLWRLGVRPGDRVGIWSPNRPEWLITQFAVARIAAVLVPLNPAYQQGELAYALNQAGVSVLLTVGTFGRSNCVGMLGNLGFGVEAGGGRLPQLMAVVCLDDDETPGMSSWRTLMGWGRDPDALPPLAARGGRRPVAILFTSGTTGAPKGATLTHRSMVNSARAVADRLRLTPQDRLCVSVPLYHCFGLVQSVLACAARGAAMVFPGAVFDPGATLDAVTRARCTALHGVPAMFAALLDELPRHPAGLDSLRTGIMAGAACADALVRRVRREFHLPELGVVYGTTETGPVSWRGTLDDPPEPLPGSVGHLLPHLQAKVVDAEGRVVPVGEPGELCVRGFSVMRGYWRDAERTAEALREGWMHTGDLATLDAQGRCRLAGRVSELVLRGDENVHPEEVETLLARHPKVAAAQVFGVPDEALGEELCAWIITRPGVACSTAEIRRFCHERLEPGKVPRYIRFVDRMPVTLTGKPRKFVMRDVMMRELGLGLVSGE